MKRARVQPRARFTEGSLSLCRSYVSQFITSTMLSYRLFLLTFKAFNLESILALTISEVGADKATPFGIL
jgi:hypothetical protein